MANHALPVPTSTYANFVSELDARFDDLAVGLDPDSVASNTPTSPSITGIPDKTIRWSGANKRWQKYTLANTSWADLATEYTININGTVGATTRNDGKFTTLSTSGIASLHVGSTVNGSAIVNTADAQTLSSKTFTAPKINDTDASHTYTIGVSQIVANRTVTLPLLAADDTFVFEGFAQTLTNKTLTAPKFASGGYIADSNGLELLKFTSVASAVNEITITNAATGVAPSIAATGGDANADLILLSQGTGKVKAGGTAAANQVVTLGGTEVLSAKTLTTPKINDTSSNNTYDIAVSELTANRTITLPLLTGNDTFVFEAHSQTLTNKTLGSANGSATWDGTTIPTNRGGTGTNVNPNQWGSIYASSTTTYASTAAGTTGQFLTATTSAAPTWQSFDLSLHAPDSSFKKVVRLATTGNLDAANYAANVLTGYSNTQSLALTTTAASTTITTTSTAGLKVGAVVNAATVQVAAGTTVAGITNATTFTISNRAAILTTAITGTGATATATFAAQTYIPYAVGSTIVITGTTPATYSGTFVVTACTTTSVSWASAETVAASVQGSIAFNIAAGTSITTNFSQTIAALSIDGSTAAVNDRILVKDQTHYQGLNTTDVAKYNGIYVVTNVGSTTVPWVLTRAADADATADLDGAVVNASIGTVNGSKSFKIHGFIGSSTLGTTPMYFNRVIDTSGSTYSGAITTARGIDIDIEAATRWLATSGTVADVVSNSFGIKALAASAASTYTRASTVYIAGAPTASTNVTLTNAYSLYVAGGATHLAGAVTLGSTLAGLSLSSTALGSAAATALTVSSGTTGALTLDSGSTGAVNLGTNANAKNINIGNATGATAVAITTGTGNLSITTPTATISGDLVVTGGDIKTGAAIASTLFSDTTSGNIAIAGSLGTGTYTVGATGSTGAVSLFPATGSQAITLGGATTGTITVGSTSATAVQLPTGKTKIGTTTLAQGGAVTITLPATAGTLAKLDNVTYIGTTSIALNRASAALALTGVSIDGSSGSCTGNAATATSATSATTAGTCTGNAGTVTNGVYTTGTQTIGGAKTFTSSVTIQNSTNEMQIYLGSNGGYMYGNATNMGFYKAAGASVSIDMSNGNFTASGNVTAYSDLRLKKDLVQIEKALDKLKTLTGYTYTRIDTGERQTGLVAQDVQKVLPEAVLTGEHLSLAYGNLVGLLVEAIKELNEKVDALK